jgi:hypothetical protein
LALDFEAFNISRPVRRNASLVEISVFIYSPPLVRNAGDVSGDPVAVVEVGIAAGGGEGGKGPIGIVLALILDVNKPHAIPIPPPITPFTAVLNIQCS